MIITNVTVSSKIDQNLRIVKFNDILKIFDMVYASVYVKKISKNYASILRLANSPVSNL